MSLPDPAAPARAVHLEGVTGLITQVASFVSAVTALVVAIVALWHAFDAKDLSSIADKKAVQAKDQSEVARKTADQAANKVALQTSDSAETAPATTSSASSYFVQLATYQTKQCETAEQEIEGYHDALSPTPGLWRSQNGQYVIVGAAVPDLASAEALQKAARKLSQDPAQAGNDLGNAVIRRAPPWQPLKTCPGS